MSLITPSGLRKSESKALQVTGPITNNTLPVSINGTTKYLPLMETQNSARYYHGAIGGINPGASGATFVPPGVNSLGGWNVTADNHALYFDVDIHSDWDGASDLIIEVFFCKNTVGGNAGDTVDLLLTSYYKGNGESVNKTQSQTVPTIVSNATRYTMFKAEFTIDWDAAGNVVEASDKFRFKLNIVNLTSECDDIIISMVSFYYNKKHPILELSDV